MVSGCGISRKTNKTKGTSFLYFWWYEDGVKNEKYLGRADERQAETEGAKMMLSFYRRQDKELHQKIGQLVEQLIVERSMSPKKPSTNASKTKPTPDYLPEFED